MYGRRNTSSRKRKRSSTVRRRRNNYGYNSRVPSTVRAVNVRSPTVLPRVMTTKFKFQTRLLLEYTGGTGVSTAFNLIANSLFDPLGTAGAAQPPMFDEMMAFYQKYEVTGCSITITANAVGDYPVLFYCTPITDLTDTYTSATASIMPGAKHKCVAAYGSGPTVATLKNYAKSSQIFGIANILGLQGTAIASPTMPWYWHISMAPILATLAENVDLALLVNLTYYTTLSDCQVVSNS